MYKALFDEKVQCSVDGGRLGFLTSFAEQVENVVSFYGTVAAPDEFKCLSSNAGKAQISFMADVCGKLKGLIYTALVVVIRHS